MACAAVEAPLNRLHAPHFSGPFLSHRAASDCQSLHGSTRRCTRDLTMTLTASINSHAIRESIRTWNAERESLDAQLAESIAALTAYQSHLDTWQRQLATDRKTLHEEREQFARERAANDKNSSESTSALAAELNAAREKITALTTLLLNRTEELRTLDNRRSEIQTELELSRAHERELKATLDESKRAAEQERSQWSDELRQLRDAMERQLDPPEAQQVEPAVASSPETPVTPAAPRPASSSGARVIPRETPVIGSIVEQFGKLRQQRAVDRQIHRPK
jgi:septal ring factor EnvC (AmiA/AmiB activator)